MMRPVLGVKGAGKSKFAALMLMRELKSSLRPIVTNLALEWDPWVDALNVARPGLLRVLRNLHGSDLDARNRIYEIQPEEIGRFWACRPRYNRQGGYPLEVRWIPKPQLRKDSPLSDRFILPPGMGPVCYIIDEVHEYFPASRWKEVGFEGLGYASQERRIGDDSWLLSQIFTNVAKPLRDQMQECYKLVNHAHLRWMGFRQPDVISYQIFNSVPTSDLEKPSSWGKLNYDRFALESVYNTSRGVGVLEDTVADMGRKAPGLHLGWLVGGALGLCVASGFGVHYGFKALGWAGRQTAGVIVPVGTPAVRLEGKPLGLIGVSGVPFGVSAEKLPRSVAVVKPRETVNYLGYARHQGLWVLELEDGATVEGRDGVLVGSSIILGGVEYRRMRRK